MKILYTILTCENYLKTRCNLIKETWLKQCDNYIFLSDRNNLFEKVVGYGVGDDYYSAPKKKKEFFKSFDFSEYDGCFFCDDDTFLFPKRIERYIEFNLTGEFVYAGRVGCNQVEFCSGGAGFYLNLNSLKKLSARLKNNSQLVITPYSDLSLGHWMKDVGISPKNVPLLLAQNPDHIENANVSPKDALSYHYCNESHFKNLSRYL